MSFPAFNLTLSLFHKITDVCPPNACHPTVCHPTVCHPDACHPNVCHPNAVIPLFVNPMFFTPNSVTPYFVTGTLGFDTNEYFPPLTSVSFEIDSKSRRTIFLSSYVKPINKTRRLCNRIKPELIFYQHSLCCLQRLLFYVNLCQH